MATKYYSNEDEYISKVDLEKKMEYIKETHTQEISKTYEEIYDIMTNIDRQMPFIVENGGGIYIPNKYNYLKSAKYSVKNNGRLINLTDNKDDITLD